MFVSRHKKTRISQKDSITNYGRLLTWLRWRVKNTIFESKNWSQVSQNPYATPLTSAQHFQTCLGKVTNILNPGPANTKTKTLKIQHSTITAAISEKGLKLRNRQVTPHGVKPNSNRSKISSKSKRKSPSRPIRSEKSCGIPLN